MKSLDVQRKMISATPSSSQGGGLGPNQENNCVLEITLNVQVCTENLFLSTPYPLHRHRVGTDY